MASLVGNKPNQVPTNGDLGTLAFQDANAVNITGGVVDVSAGTAALPTLGTTGDPDTGVFFPAANTVAASTNGVERVRIDSSGNLGIGTSSPIYPLDVYSAASGIIKVRGGTSTNQGSGFFVWKADNTGSLAAFGDSARIVGGTPDQGVTVFANSVPISFYTGSERMRITSAGQLRTTVTGTTMMDDYGCRAWVNFNGTGTVAIRASGNVSSITDNGTGNYTINFTTAMPDANYSAVATDGSTGNNSNCMTSSYAVGSFIVTDQVGTSAGYQDSAVISAAVFR